MTQDNGKELIRRQREQEQERHRREVQALDKRKSSENQRHHDAMQRYKLKHKP